MAKNEVNFNQGDFIDYLKRDHEDLDPQKKAEALKLLNKYNGLCDIICNQITQENLLENREKLEPYSTPNNVQDLIKYSSTHALNINSITRFFELIICLVLGYYPESPLSWSDQKALNNSRTKNIAINKCLSEMKDGDYYKFCTINRQYGCIVNGHSMLLYKSSDNKFTFFDPNHGAIFDLSQQEILTKLHGLKFDFSGVQSDEIAIMDNKKFLEKHHSGTVKKITDNIEENKTKIKVLNDFLNELLSNMNIHEQRDLIFTEKDNEGKITSEKKVTLCKFNDSSWYCVARNKFHSPLDESALKMILQSQKGEISMKQDMKKTHVDKLQERQNPQDGANLAYKE